MVIYYKFDTEANHNKDYSEVKTFTAVPRKRDCWFVMMYNNQFQTVYSMWTVLILIILVCGFFSRLLGQDTTKVKQYCDLLAFSK
jgi:hypothetical protein